MCCVLGFQSIQNGALSPSQTGPKKKKKKKGSLRINWTSLAIQARSPVYGPMFLLICFLKKNYMDAGITSIHKIRARFSFKLNAAISFITPDDPAAAELVRP